MSELKRSGSNVSMMQLPSAGNPGSSQPLHKRDIPTVVKGLKNHSKNATVCREYVVALHCRLFEDSKEGKENCAKFLLNSVGGISTLLQTLDNNCGDAIFAEVALVFLYNLVHVGGKRNPRVVMKLVKRGAGRICVAAINKSQTNLRVIQPACMVVIALGMADSKLPSLARLTGCLGTLLGLCKVHTMQPKAALSSILCCLTTLSRGDLNLLHMWKRGAVPIVLDICMKNMQRDGSSVLRWAFDFLNKLCHYDENAKEVVKEGGISLTINTCFEQCSAVDVQVVCLDTLKLLIAFPEGMAQFHASGGFPYVLNLITENNADKNEEEWLALINQLYKLVEYTELPIGTDNDLYWSPPELAHVDSDDVMSDVGDESTPVDVPNPNAGIRYEDFSPELQDGDFPPETSINEANFVHHVKPFTDPRPSPSCPSSIEFVPPVEELWSQTPRQRVEVIRRQLKRFTHATFAINKVVYDDMARDTALPQNRLAQLCPPPQLDSQSSQSVVTPAPPPASPYTAGAQRPSFLNASMSGSASAIASGAVPTLKFGSNFECGNLKRAIQVFDDEYDLILQPDINTQSYIQWFYFSVENARSDVTYKFNIINMEKPTSTFNDGQRPLIFSEKRFTWSGFGWLRTGHDICYYKNNYKRVSVGKRRKDGGSGFYTLSFSVRFPHDEDRAYIANCYPYSYSDLISYLRKLQDKKSLDGCVSVQSLCKTQSGNICPLLTITSLRKDGEDCDVDEIKQRGVCVVSARVHPGESNASYMAKGLIDYLLDSTEQAQYLRDNFVWKIIPMLNPDGVVNGNHRCSLSAKDLNREFITPDKILNPTIYYLKEVVKHYKLTEGRNVVLYGDFHGHSRCKNFVIYACSARKPTAGIIPEKLFPRILGDLAPYFSYPNCTYLVQRGKRTTGRVVFFRELGIRMSFTLEGSMMGGYGCDFVPLSFGEMEEDICRRSALSRMTLAHFNTSHFQTLGSMFAKSLMVLSQGDRGINPKANDFISELIAETSMEKGGAKREPSSRAIARAQTSDEEASASSMSGSYASSRRNTIRKKKAAQTSVQVPPATPAELQEVYKVLLHTQGLTKAALTEGDEIDEDDDDDLADAEEEDSDGGDDPENEDYEGIEEDEMENLEEI